MPAPTATSLIDCVDEDDRPLGRVDRGDALRLGANFRTVHVFVFHDQLLLLQLLARSRERNPGRWGSSVAAYLHAGEEYEEAAHRRLWEELGLEGSLTRVGKTRMRDERSLKFVELYTLLDGPAEIREPDHIEALSYWPSEELDRTLAESPEIFTPTFLHLHKYFERRRPTLQS
jgi:isopentenyldiphosphate isomerase